MSINILWSPVEADGPSTQNLVSVSGPRTPRTYQEGIKSFVAYKARVSRDSRVGLAKRSRWLERTKKGGWSGFLLWLWVGDT